MAFTPPRMIIVGLLGTVFFVSTVFFVLLQGGARENDSCATSMELARQVEELRRLESTVRERQSTLEGYLRTLEEERERAVTAVEAYHSALAAANAINTMSEKVAKPCACQSAIEHLTKKMKATQEVVNAQSDTMAKTEGQYSKALATITNLRAFVWRLRQLVMSLHKAQNEPRNLLSSSTRLSQDERLIELLSSIRSQEELFSLPAEELLENYKALLAPVALGEITRGLGAFSSLAEEHAFFERWKAHAIDPARSSWFDTSIDNVFVMIHTHKDGFLQRRERIMRTWGKHTRNLWTFLGSYPDDLGHPPSTPNTTVATRPELSVLVGEDLDPYKMLWKKVAWSFSYVCDNVKDKFDWFMKIDDDAFLVTYNLGSYLKSFDPKIPLYIGVRMKFGGQTYASGGAGYALSKGLMSRMCVEPPPTRTGPDGEVISQQTTGGQPYPTYWDLCRFDPPYNETWWSPLSYWGKPEDVFTGACIERSINVTMTPGKGFHSNALEYKKQPLTEFYNLRRNAKNPQITFHYVTPFLMYQMYREFY